MVRGHHRARADRGAAQCGVRVRDQSAHAAAVRGGYQAFWWVVTLLLLALPVLVGYGVAKLSTRALGIVGGVVALFVIAILVLGQMFVF
jgi:amino acid transporter